MDGLDGLLGAVGAGIARIWTSATTPSAPSDPWLVAAAAALALFVVLVTPVWRRARHAVTIAHEGFHGVAALLTGRRLRGIRLHSDTSGLTVSRGRPSGPGMVVTLLAGYPGPALAGLGGAWLLDRGYGMGVLWLLVLLLALLLLQIRNLFGLWSVLVSGVLLAAVSWWGTPALADGAAHAVVWFLLLGSVRPVLELQASRAQGGAGTSDADQLARLTRVPGIVWVSVFLVACVAATGLGVLWLLVE